MIKISVKYGYYCLAWKIECLESPEILAFYDRTNDTKIKVISVNDITKIEWVNNYKGEYND